MKDNSRLHITNSKKYLRKYSNSRYMPDGNSSFYLAAYTKSVGYYLLKKIFKIKSKNFFENLICIISDIYFGVFSELYKKVG